jgi:hypothetical protein
MALASNSELQGDPSDSFSSRRSSEEKKRVKESAVRRFLEIVTVAADSYGQGWFEVDAKTDAAIEIANIKRRPYPLRYERLFFPMPSR